ncbi:low temperature requirement protein A [Micromonospora sp. M12]
MAFTTSALLWRIYFHRAGLLLSDALERVAMPGRLGTLLERTHLLIVLSVLVTAVGYELVIDHPFGQPQPGWLLFVVGGPMLFLVARMGLEYEIFGRVSRSRVIGLAALLLSTPMLAHWTPMVALSVVAGVLALVALLDTLRSWGQPVEVPTSPIGRETSGARDSEA